MSKPLNAILAVARERISGGNAAGRMGSEQSTSLGKDPGVDYAPKPEGERKFVAKHKHIEMEYPNGSEPQFTGATVKYSMDDHRMSRYGNKQDQAKAAYEEVEQDQLDEISRKTLGSYVSKSAGEISHHRASMANHQIAGNKDAYNNAKRKTINRVKGVEKAGDRLAKEEVQVTDKTNTKPIQTSGPAKKPGPTQKSTKADSKLKGQGTVREEQIDELWKATQNDQGQHILKHKSGKVSSKTYASKGEAIDAAVRRNRVSGAFKEAYDALDEKESPKVPSNEKSDDAKAKESLKKRRFNFLHGEAVVHNESSIHIKHPGALTRAAKRAGESNSEYEHAHAHDKGLAGKRARFAINAKKWHHEDLERVEGIDLIEGPVLCDKDSLKRKAKYHKGKMSSEQAGSPRFRHHQRQAHIIKGMLEETDEQLDEISKALAGRYITRAHQSGATARSAADKAFRARNAKSKDKFDYKDDKRTDGISRAVSKLTGSAKVNAKEEVEVIDEKKKDNVDTIIDKRGNVVKKRGYQSKKKEEKKLKGIKEEVDVVARAVVAITEGRYKWQN